MNRPTTDSLLAPGPLVIAGLVALAALTRLLPHPPNFSPVEAIALFAGATIASRRWAFVVPIIGLLLSDIALAAIHGGIYAGYFGSTGMWLVYACIALTTVLGFGLRGRAGSARILGYSLAGSVLFYLVTNFGVWLGAPMYPKNVSGLAAAYAAGIPFFQWTVLGTLSYAALLFGGFAMLRRRLPALQSQTV